MGTLRLGPRTRTVWYPETTEGADPSPVYGWVMPLSGEAGFSDTQPRVAAPFFTGSTEAEASVLGLIADAGDDPINRDFVFDGHMERALFGDGYAHVATTDLHEFYSGGTPRTGQVQEEWLQSVAQYKRHRNVGVGKIQDTFATNGPAVYRVTLIGLGDVLNTADDGGSANLGGTITASTEQPSNYFFGRLILDGVAIGKITAFDLTRDIQLKSVPVGFNDGKGGGLAYGKLKASVKMTILFNTVDNLARYQKAKADGVFTLECLWANLGGTGLSLGTRWKRMIMKKVKLPRPKITMGGNNETTEQFDGMIEFDPVGGGRGGELIGSVKAPVTVVVNSNDVVSLKVDGNTVAATAQIPAAAYTSMDTLAAAVPVIPTSAPGQAVAVIDPTPTAGLVDDGTHVYAISFVTGAGETSAGPISSVVTIADHTVNGKVVVTLPIGPAGVTARKIYRSAFGTTTPLKLVATQADNTATTYLDHIAESGQGANAVYPLSGVLVDTICGFLRITSTRPNPTASNSSVQATSATHDANTLLGLDLVSHSGFDPHSVFVQLKTGGLMTADY